jgi:ornithine cyclodeaminase/alanine dehydrogenase-like protein (mu-crystallin family)
LNYVDLRRLLSTISLREFFEELIAEIDSAYRDPMLKAEDRVGWFGRDTDTLEMMGCETPESSCVKVIDSTPSVGNSLSQVVEGTLTFNQTVDAQRVQLHTDATVLTPLRTAASSAALLRSIKPQFETLGVVGSGLEGTSHAFVLALMFEGVRQIVLTDVDIERAQRAANRVKLLLTRAEVPRSRDIEISYADASDLTSVYGSDVLVTATYGVAAHGASPVLDITRDNRPKDGAIILAVGADVKGKRELGDGIYDAARFVADSLRQCFRDGELQHAAPRLGIQESEIAALPGHAGELLDGRVVSVANLLRDEARFLGRSETVTVYDSTGFSGQDLAIARVVRRFLEARSWPKGVWNPPGEADLYELMVDPGDLG